jgi:hypothetical protein
MYVAIVNQTSPTGSIKPNQFRDAVDEATALADFLAQPPAKTPADWLAYDTTWGGPVQPSEGTHWEYDFDAVSPPPGDRMIEVDNTGLQICFVVNMDASGKQDVITDGSWQTMLRFVLAPDEICPTNRFVLRPRFEYRFTTGGPIPKMRVTENGVLYGAEKTDLVASGTFIRDVFRAGGTAANGMNTYAIECDRDGATLFEIRAVTVEIAQRDP